MLKPEDSGVSPLPAMDVTRCLKEFRDGNCGALDRAFTVVYRELRKLAQQQLYRERPGHTLAATGLVHEAYLKLVGDSLPDCSTRAQFFSLAARAMREVLIDHARRKKAAKRGGEQHQTTLDDCGAVAGMDYEELLALNTGLDRLGELEPRLRAIVEYRFFCGLEQREIAELLGVTERTVERGWARARAWLYKELYSRSPQ